MGKGKSVAARRRQRHKQKLRKVLSKSRRLDSMAITDDIAPAGGAVLPEEIESKLPVHDSSSSTFGSPGTPPSTPVSDKTQDNQHKVQSSGDMSLAKLCPHLFDNNYYRESVDKADDDMLHQIEEYSPNHRCEALKELFLERTKSLHYYRERVDELQLEMDDKSIECRRKIRSIRNFWKDRIYHEQSRSGTLLKNALR